MKSIPASAPAEGHKRSVCGPSGRPTRAHPGWGSQAALSSTTHYPGTRKFSSVPYPPVLLESSAAEK